MFLTFSPEEDFSLFCPKNLAARNESRVFWTVWFALSTNFFRPSGTTISPFPPSGLLLKLHPPFETDLAWSFGFPRKPGCPHLVSVTPGVGGLFFGWGGCGGGFGGGGFGFFLFDVNVLCYRTQEPSSIFP